MFLLGLEDPLSWMQSCARLLVDELKWQQNSFMLDALKDAERRQRFADQCCAELCFPHLSKMVLADLRYMETPKSGFAR